MELTAKGREKIQRALGVIEGVAGGLEGRVQYSLYHAVTEIEQALELDEEGDDGDK